MTASRAATRAFRSSWSEPMGAETATDTTATINPRMTTIQSTIRTFRPMDIHRVSRGRNARPYLRLKRAEDHRSTSLHSRLLGRVTSPAHCQLVARARTTSDGRRLRFEESLREQVGPAGLGTDDMQLNG